MGREPEGGQGVERVYVMEWGQAAMGRGAGLWICFGHGIGLVCMSMCVVKAGVIFKTEISGEGSTFYPGEGG
jgi:hypothetical protein